MFCFVELLVADFSEDFEELFDFDFFVGDFGGLPSLFFVLVGLLLIESEDLDLVLLLDLEDLLDLVLLLDLEDLLDLADLEDLVVLVDTSELPLLIDSNEHVLLVGDSNDRTLSVDRELTES
jgi:hypothetical protein